MCGAEVVRRLIAANDLKEASDGKNQSQARIEACNYFVAEERPPFRTTTTINAISFTPAD